MAGGGGRRFGRLKQYESLVPGGSERVIDRSRRTAEAVSDGVVLVVPEDDVGREGGVAGGSTRSESVRNGLAAVPDDADVVVVHDAARPLAPQVLFERVIAAIDAGADGAVPGTPVADTIKVVDPDDGAVVDTPDRSRLVAVQTPQAFRADVLRRAHRNGGDATDDAALVEADGGRVVVVDGDPSNRKLTTREDLDWMRARLRERL